MLKEGDPKAPILFTPDELRLLGDEQFFRAKARIMTKMKAMLDGVHGALQKELAEVTLLAPDGFNLAAHQFVKGEHLEDCPYQYLDCFKHFDGAVKFTYRTLLWWGHHSVCAVILEGGHLAQYKKNLMNRYGAVADQGLSLCLGGSAWEWKRGEGYTMDLTWERKNELQALLDRRAFVKLARFVPFDDPIVQQGRLPEVAATTLRRLLPIITPVVLCLLALLVAPSVGLAEAWRCPQPDGTAIFSDRNLTGSCTPVDESVPLMRLPSAPQPGEMPPASTQPEAATPTPKEPEQVPTPGRGRRIDPPSDASITILDVKATPTFNSGLGIAQFQATLAMANNDTEWTAAKVCVAVRFRDLGGIFVDVTQIGCTEGLKPLDTRSVTVTYIGLIPPRLFPIKAEAVVEYVKWTK